MKKEYYKIISTNNRELEYEYNMHETILNKYINNDLSTLVSEYDQIINSYIYLSKTNPNQWHYLFKIIRDTKFNTTEIDLIEIWRGNKKNYKHIVIKLNNAIEFKKKRNLETY